MQVRPTADGNNVDVEYDMSNAKLDAWAELHGAPAIIVATGFIAKDPKVRAPLPPHPPPPLFPSIPAPCRACRMVWCKGCEPCTGALRRERCCDRGANTESDGPGTCDGAARCMCRARVLCGTCPRRACFCRNQAWLAARTFFFSHQTCISALADLSMSMFVRAASSGGCGCRAT